MEDPEDHLSGPPPPQKKFLSTFQCTHTKKNLFSFLRIDLEWAVAGLAPRDQPMSCCVKRYFSQVIVNEVFTDANDADNDSMFFPRLADLARPPLTEIMIVVGGSRT